jgi:hypothetical protein
MVALAGRNLRIKKEGSFIRTYSKKEEVILDGKEGEEGNCFNDGGEQGFPSP